MIDKIPLLQQMLAGARRSAQFGNLDATRRDAATTTARPLPVAEPAGKIALERRVRQRIAQIGPDDPQRRRRALRVVVESSLLTEFGERLEADPEFQAMVDQVAKTMDEDPQLKLHVDQALQGYLT